MSQKLLDCNVASFTVVQSNELKDMCFPGILTKALTLETRLSIKKDFKAAYVNLTDPETVNLTTVLCRTVSLRFSVMFNCFHT
jgi:hypothetical protein